MMSREFLAWNDKFMYSKKLILVWIWRKATVHFQHLEMLTATLPVILLVVTGKAVSTWLTTTHSWKSNVMRFGILVPFEGCNCSFPKILKLVSANFLFKIPWWFCDVSSFPIVLLRSFHFQSPLELRTPRGSFIESWFLDVCLRDEEVTVNLNVLGEIGINLGDCLNLLSKYRMRSYKGHIIFTTCFGEVFSAFRIGEMGHSKKLKPSPQPSKCSNPSRARPDLWVSPSSFL